MFNKDKEYIQKEYSKTRNFFYIKFNKNLNFYFVFKIFFFFEKFLRLASKFSNSFAT